MNVSLGSVISIIVVLFFLSAAVKPFPQIVSIIMFLVCLAYFFVQKNKQDFKNITIDQNERIVYLSLMLMAFCTLPPLFIDNSFSYGLRELNIGAEYLLFAFIVLLLFKLKPTLNHRFVFYAIMLAGILNGCIAIMQLYIYPMGGRLDGYTGINEYGLICAVLCVLNAILFIFYQANRYEKAIYLLASCLSIFGLLGSALRGVMLAVLFALVVMFVVGVFLRQTNLKTFCISWCVIVLGIVCSVCIFYSTYSTARITETQAEFQRIQSGNLNSSVGLRLQMYQEAWAMFKISPLFGMSAKTRLEKAQEIAGIAKTTHILDIAKDGKPIYGKMHNDILNFMAKRGIIGLASLLFFYFALINMCYRNRNNIFGKLAFGLILVYIGSGFSGDSISGYAEFAFFMLAFIFIIVATYTRENQS